MKTNRREFLKNAAAAAATTALIGCAGQDAASGLDKSLSWQKAPCRYCGTGCGVLVGVRDGRIEAVAGDFRCGDGLAEPRETFPFVSGTHFANPYVVRRSYAQLVLCPLCVCAPLELVLRIERDVCIAFSGENPIFVFCNFIERIPWKIRV